MEFSEESFVSTIQTAVRSVYHRGFELLAESPERFTAMSGQAFAAYLPELAADLQTVELRRLLDDTRGWLENSGMTGTPEQREATRMIFWQCMKDAVPSLDWTHPQRVARISRAVGAELGLSEQALHDLYWGGLLHDVGKAFVEDLANHVDATGAIHAGFPMLRTHAGLGGLLMESARPLFPLGAICAGQHQESVDGSGYPGGLVYEQLTQEGRIVNLADGYDATVTRAGWTLAQACEESLRIYTRAGHADAPVLRAFFRVVEQFHTSWYGTD